MLYACYLLIQNLSEILQKTSNDIKILGITINETTIRVSEI